jgi:ACS family tartrate transporter-like MFS transporter
MIDNFPAIRKIRLRVVLPLLLLLVVSSIDRVNISFAALQMNTELALSHREYGLAISAFFLGYLFFQFPSIALLKKYGARKWIFGSVLLWGMLAIGMVFVQGRTSLYVLRFLLGLAEAGFAPGVVYLCGVWMPKRYRAAAIGLTMLAVPVSVIIGGPISGWLMSLHGVAVPVSGWRWMFLAEGALTIAFAAFALKVVCNGPQDASWLSAAEKQWLHEQHSLDATGADNSLASIRAVFLSPSIWAAGGLYFVLIAGAYGILFWLPQVIRQMSNVTVFETGVISALPWIGIGLGMYFNARHSDRTGERYKHVIIPSLLCSVCLALATLTDHRLLALALLFVAGIGLGGAQSVFWTLPTNFLTQDVAGQGIAAISLCGNLGGLFGPFALGLILQASGSYRLPAFVMAALLVGGALLAVILRRGDPSIAVGNDKLPSVGARTKAVGVGIDVDAG